MATDLEIARAGVMKEIAEKRRIEAEKAGAALKADGAAEKAKMLGYKDKADQGETWIPTGPAGTPGARNNIGGYWARAGYEEDEEEVKE